MRQVGDVQLKLLGKADTVELEQQLLQLRHALQDAMQGAVARDEFEDRLSRKLDVDTFLASVAARQQAARQRKQAKHPQRVDDIEL
jgi:non-homologous end joining protein Ku